MEESVCVFSVEFPEILEVLEALLSEICWNICYNMVVVVPRLIHYELLRGDEAEWALVEVKNLL